MATDTISAKSPTKAANLSSIKQALRKSFLKKRALIDDEKREKAALQLKELVLTIKQPYILSYSSIHSELKTGELNQRLAKEGRLILPKTEEKELSLYLVKNIEKELLPGKYNILEPNPSLCKKILPKNIPFAIVPALAFDKRCNRLGYGRGYYDRLIKRAPHLYTVGVGFKEQESFHPLPNDQHDKPVNTIQLF